MSAQTGAAARNTQAELLVDTALRLAFEELAAAGFVSNVLISRQVSFQRDDCSDVFDHRIEFESIGAATGLASSVEIWGQTTCYKGQASDPPESNKTYEIRETLVEALGLRRWLVEEKAAFRTAHFTVGPAAYAYAWFGDAKKASFDLSLYPPEGAGSLFAELDNLLAGSATETSSAARLRASATSGQGAVPEYLRHTTSAVVAWGKAGFPRQDLADAQAQLLSDIRVTTWPEVEPSIERSAKGGAAIKRKVAAILEGGDTDDAALLRTAAKVANANPFLGEALRAEASWASWCDDHVPAPQGELDDYISELWNVETPARGVVRRLLLRIHDPAGVAYVADLGIKGLTEHLLYSGNFTQLQVDELRALLLERFVAAGLDTPAKIRTSLISTAGLRLLRSSRRAESINGSNIKPSFRYIEEALPDRYRLVRFGATNLPAPLGYQATFTKATVGIYTNLQVVLNALEEPVAIIKGKFFSQNEFPRRAKEETYLGVTLMHHRDGDTFPQRYGGLPLIMFVDMDADTAAPVHAITRLVTAGWHLVFSIDELVAFLDA
jgi:hypothetical protein